MEGITDAKLLNQFILKNLHLPTEETELKSITYLVLDHLFQLNKTDVITERKITLTERAKAKLTEVIVRLNKEEPIQYILGTVHFYGHEFNVTPDVLIPRPETEELVDRIIKENKGTQLRVLDIGTGSGCIAISLQKNLNNAEVHAIEVAPGALTVATENAKNNNASISFILADVLAELPPLPQFDIIVSNPPYVLEKETALMNKNVLDHEPHQALFVPDNNPLLFYRRIISLADMLLKPNGKLYLEINENFGEVIKQLIFTKGYSEVVLIKDMQKKDRFIVAVK